MRNNLIVLSAVILSASCAASTTRTTSHISTRPTAITADVTPQICVDAANATRNVFANAADIIGLSGEFFSAISDLDMDAAETAANKIGAAAQEASGQAETATRQLSDCRDANPPVACTRMADAAGDAASLLASTLQTIMDANDALGNMDVDGLQSAAAETENLRDPLLEATRRFESASSECVGSQIEENE
jgi:hypothetical protein